MGDRGPGRPRRDGLSERQKQVLDLLAAGRTNAEVGEALGMSIDGAKYHVRELMDYTGFDTREELAEWWRQERGLSARFAVTPAWRRLPRPLRWVAVTAAGAGAALAATLGFAFLFAANGPDDTLADVWLALPMPSAAPGAETGETEVRVVNTSTREEFTLGEPGLWRDLTFSPDGRLLYGLRVPLPLDDAADVQLHVFDLERRATVATEAWPFENCTCAPESAVWAPDGTAVAVPAVGIVGVLGAAGGLSLADTGLSVTQVAWQTDLAAWAPDSSRYVHVPDSSLASDLRIVSRTGDVIAVSLPGTIVLPPHLRGDDYRRQVESVAWADADTIQVVMSAYRWDAVRDVPINEPAEFWRLSGTVESGGVMIGWEPGTRLSAQEEADLFARPDLPPVFRDSPPPTGSIVHSSVSKSRAFGGGIVIDPPRTGPDSERAVRFLVGIDGEVFEYALGTDWSVAYTSEIWVNWDAARVE